MKRMTLLLAITITAVALTQTSTAQMMGGGSSGGGTGSGGHGGTGMGSGGSTGGAGGTGMGSGGGMVGSGGIGMGSGMGTGPGGGMDGAGRLLVTPGGTAFVVTRDSATSGGSIMSAKLVAIGSNGQKAWTWDASGPIQDVATVGDLLIVDVADPSAVGSMQAGAGQATLVALHAATGTETWRLPLGGVSGPVRRESEIASSPRSLPAEHLSRGYSSRRLRRKLSSRGICFGACRLWLRAGWRGSLPSEE